MKQPDRLLDEANSQFRRCLEARLVVLTSCRRRKVFDAGAGTAVDVVGEREEGVA